MKSIEILALGIRIVGIYLILELFQFSANSYTSIQQWKYINPDESVIPWLVLYGLISFVIMAACFLFIKFPVTVSRWLLPNSGNDEPVFNGSIDDLRMSAFIIMGVYILSWAVPDFFYNATMLIHQSNQDIADLYNPVSKRELIIDEFITVIEIAIGLYLCLGSKGINSLIVNFRGRGGS